jgi:hypothetical protein
VSKGTVVITGHRYAVTDVRLRDGKIVVLASGPGPQPERHGVYPCTLFGEDGTGIYQADLQLDHPACGKGDVLTVICPVRMVEVTSWQLRQDGVRDA